MFPLVSFIFISITFAFVSFDANNLGLIQLCFRFQPKKCVDDYQNLHKMNFQ